MYLNAWPFPGSTELRGYGGFLTLGSLGGYGPLGTDPEDYGPASRLDQSLLLCLTM